VDCIRAGTTGVRIETRLRGGFETEGSEIRGQKSTTNQLNPET